MMVSTKNLVTAVKNTLDTVAVVGVENMRKMVLCHDTLEHILEHLDPAADEGSEEEATDDG